MTTKFGLTWWGQRWITALEALGRTYANRLPRGRTYARNGSVTDLTIAAGLVTARVAGSRPTPYRVSLRIPVFSDAQWTAAAHALARQLRHAAALLDGRKHSTRSACPCSPGHGTSPPNARAPTSPTHASTSRRSTTPSPKPSTPTLSCCRHCADAIGPRCLPAFAWRVRDRRWRSPPRRSPSTTAYRSGHCRRPHCSPHAPI